MFDRQKLRLDLYALALLGVSAFLFVALAGYNPGDPPASNVYPAPSSTRNLLGWPGALAAHAMQSLFGMAAWLVVIALVILDARLFARLSYRDPKVRACGFLVLLAAICVTLQGLAPGLGRVPIAGSGGYLGAWGLAFLQEQFTPAGIVLCVLTALVVGGMLAADTLVVKLLAACVSAPYVWFHRFGFGASNVVELPVNREPLTLRDTTAAVQNEITIRPPAAGKAAVDESEDEVEAAQEQELSHTDAVFVASAEAPANGAAAPVSFVSPPAARTPRVNAPIAAMPANPVPAERRAYVLPPVQMLEMAEPFPFEVLAEKARAAAAVLERTFQEFGLNVRVVEIDTGPVITQFELELEAGLRLSKVTALADDLAIALRVPSVRVVAPIPGKNTVGVEVPNDRQVMVRLRELMEACPDAAGKKRIPIFLGKDVSGRPLVVDLAKMPHLLIAGRTGTGKSVCLNALILSILMTRTPDQVKMLMIDPKMVELSPYKRVPHLMHPVITDMKKAEAVLAWAVEKMEERYDLLARCGVRHLDSYNELSRDQLMNRLGLDPDSDEASQIPERMPYIVIIADEMADMMMTSGKEVEGHIIRLAQKSRAVGIHLVLATQKPTVDVITGLIKSNLPARIAFQVASRVDSRVVLDEMGAERLLGNGDMLYLMPGTSKITRAQGTFVSDAEVNITIEFFRGCEPEYSTELAKLSARGGGKSGIEAIRNRDELYEQAIDIVVREGRGSTSLLQRALGIGYGRAARLIDYMAEDGIVGDYNGSQAREVLYSPEQWAELVAGAKPEEAVA
jgi:S-DNA-T family DNA segregation ATPase FtsK/SpoIIIE